MTKQAAGEDARPTKNIKPKTEIACYLWRRGDVTTQDGTLPRAWCAHYEEGRCKHKSGPLFCPTGGQRSAWR